LGFQRKECSFRQLQVIRKFHAFQWIGKPFIGEFCALRLIRQPFIGKLHTFQRVRQPLLGKFHAVQRVQQPFIGKQDPEIADARRRFKYRYGGNNA
jgi:hypothetical protein